MRAVLYVAAKAPRPGFAKTRLGRAIGHDRAAALAGAFLRDLAARLARAPALPFEVAWFITPPDAWPEIAPLVADLAPARVVAQGEGDWGERQRALFREAAARGEGRVVVLASDSPHTSVATIAAAFAALERADLVIGPVRDGGYYLLGMRGWHDVLRDVAMSTGNVARDIAAAAARAGLSIAQVETSFDVDEVDDLRHLRELVPSRDDLPATRAILATLPERPTPAARPAPGAG